MRSRTRNWVYSGLVLALLAGSQTGCKSGWKMPGGDMFSWGRKPSESTLMGNGPSVSTPGPSTTASNAPKSMPNPSSPGSNGAMSPALRSNPNQIVSNAVNPTATARPSGPGFGGYGPNGAAPQGGTPYGSAPNAGAPLGGAPYGTTAGVAPTPGAAATSNGYTTGAYATNQSRPPMNGAPSAYGQNMPAPQTQAPQIPLAQGTAPVPTGTPNYSYPTPNAPQSYAGMSVPPMNAPVAGNSNGALPPPVAPQGYNMIPPPASAAPNIARSGGGMYAPSVPQGVPAMNASSGSNLPPSIPPASQMPMAYGGNAPSSMPTMTPPAAQGANRYLPGSMSRNTPYDFSNQGPGAAPSAPAGTYPKTASDPTRSMNR
ncbi:MAG: hypothetical protein ACK553_08345 [Planctomycetota bacterium]|jgi:hypothetical protein